MSNIVTKVVTITKDADIAYIFFLVRGVGKASVWSMAMPTNGSKASSAVKTKPTVWTKTDFR